MFNLITKIRQVHLEIGFIEMSYKEPKSNFTFPF